MFIGEQMFIQMCKLFICIRELLCMREIGGRVERKRVRVLGEKERVKVRETVKERERERERRSRR